MCDWREYDAWSTVSVRGGERKARLRSEIKIKKLKIGKFEILGKVTARRATSHSTGEERAKGNGTSGLSASTGLPEREYWRIDGRHKGASAFWLIAVQAFQLWRRAKREWLRFTVDSRLRKEQTAWSAGVQERSVQLQKERLVDSKYKNGKKKKKMKLVTIL